jgi:MFS family permease
LIAGTIALAAAIAFESLALIFASAVIEGAGQGLAIGAGLAAINERVRERRGEVSSTYFVLVYVALALPVIGVGLLASAWALPPAALVFCGAVTVIVAFVLTTLLRRQSSA